MDFEWFLLRVPHLGFTIAGVMRGYPQAGVTNAHCGDRSPCLWTASLLFVVRVRFSAVAHEWHRGARPRGPSPCPMAERSAHSCASILKTRPDTRSGARRRRVSRRPPPAGPRVFSRTDPSTAADFRHRCSGGGNSRRPTASSVRCDWFRVAKLSLSSTYSDSHCESPAFKRTLDLVLAASSIGTTHKMWLIITTL